MNVTGFEAKTKGSKSIVNHSIKEFSQPVFEDMNANHERHISKNLSNKNRDDITARGKFALVMALQICVAQSASNQNR